MSDIDYRWLPQEPPAVPAHLAPNVTRPAGSETPEESSASRPAEAPEEARPADTSPPSRRSFRDIVASLERARAERQGAAPARERAADDRGAL